EIAMKAVLPDAVRKEEEGWRERLYVRALPQHDQRPKLTKRQEDLWTIIEEWRELPLQEFVRLAGTTSATIRKLEDKGLVSIAPQISERDPYANEHIMPTKPLELNNEQSVALNSIVKSIDNLDRSESSLDEDDENNAFLLHGVTGSGKTEVYLQAIAYALEKGKGAIVLVPEISLTPQTVERFKARFSQGSLQTLVAVLHSHLSAGERHDEWHKIRQGRARIVIGARSAVFAPVEPLGLVIVDEEHEHSYKQEEAPRYNARDLAVVRGRQEGAAVVLGSATPCMESYYNVQRKKYCLLSLTERADEKTMPIVRVVDMRNASRKEKGISIFSPQLREAILQRLEKKEQVMLFLNRRGWSSSLQCTECGFVAECPNCSVSLTYHRSAQQLMCHICGHIDSAPSKCPEQNCGNSSIRFSGLGTEKVEAALDKSFPSARVKRMDSDTLKRKEDYRRILGDFRSGKIDILVGTQMIAKGLHFPNVTLVGIIHADLSLHIPDFRAGERTFQLLTQVAGRAGRGDVEGEVYIQSFTPFHPAIQYARRHDYIGFYDQEIEFRQQLRYPPVGRVALLTLRGRSEDRVRFFADHLRKEMDALAKELGDVVVAGPAPAPLLRAENFYRYQIMMRTSRMPQLSRKLSLKIDSLKISDDLRLIIDIDPMSLS
ncbi:MAG: primosomal protein N', partial [Verrucomicrobiota bacterium]|nr:primosomal protein N' [Verrucomicrobiota bacterium]